MVEPRLAVVIPAYREENSIGAVVSQAKAYGAVLVIDDCSPDATGAQADLAGATVIRNETNLGYDGTLTRGVRECAALGFTHVITIDADGEHDPSLLGRFRTALLDQGYALVLGYRPRKQRAAEVVMGWYFRARFGVRDILCGMKGYSLAYYGPQFPGFGGSIGTAPAFQALCQRARFVQIPVTGQPRQDAPRFDRRLRANMRILAALRACVKQDVLGR